MRLDGRWSVPGAEGDVSVGRTGGGEGAGTFRPTLITMGDHICFSLPGALSRLLSGRLLLHLKSVAYAPCVPHR